MDKAGSLTIHEPSERTSASPRRPFRRLSRVVAAIESLLGVGAASRAGLMKNSTGASFERHLRAAKEGSPTTFLCRQW